MKQRELEREKEEHKRMMEREKHSESLRLKAEHEEHQQKLLDIKLARTAERGEKEREVERLREEHLRRMEREKFSDNHENQKLTVNLEMKKKEMSLDLDKQRISMEKERLDGMKGSWWLSVEMLTSQSRFPLETNRPPFIFTRAPTEVHGPPALNLILKHFGERL